MKSSQIIDNENVPTQVIGGNSNWKVKIFNLNSEGEWIGGAIGQCEILQKVFYILAGFSYLLRMDNIFCM